MQVVSKSVEIAPGVHWVGSVDWQRRIFDAFVTLPNGTSYNAYLVIGSDKVALIDSVAPGFESELLAKISAIIDPQRIDYLVMNHAEPDHANAIKAALVAAPKAKVVATKKGVEMAKINFDVPAERALEVKSGDTLDLGGKTLAFTEAPWLHWPETMFTMAQEDGILFTCDFLGSHIASDRLYADQIEGIVIPEARRYYAEIMMPYRTLAEKGLDKAIAAKPRMIAPSHGPVHRHPQAILDAHVGWVRGPLPRKALLLYVSMWGSTKKMADVVAASLQAAELEVVPFDLTAADISHVASELVDAAAVVVGSPTFLAGPHPLVAYALTLVRALRPRVKIAAFFGSYGWGGGAAAQVKNLLEPAGFTIADAFEIKGPPKEADLERAVALSRAVAARITEQLG